MNLTKYMNDFIPQSPLTEPYYHIEKGEIT
jgi:hypothetical protein